MLKCISCGKYYVPGFLVCSCQLASDRFLLPCPFERAQIEDVFETDLSAHGAPSEQSDGPMQDTFPGSSSPPGRHD